ncbi:hypothetical protein HPB52_004406 [Rhipicephalus sanguineus]|uniref:Peptidase M13 N-terminal domain-containing protein n=1 Tax=Rhipicephalus sanguineus TaxID=34632 RepID=A0A9D4T1E9_RHISA|nr:hypothetical protein HPB52_004406 [Rhipicephalus sanguineus]
MQREHEHRQSSQAPATAPTSLPNVSLPSVASPPIQSQSPISENSPQLAAASRRDGSSSESAEAEPHRPTTAAMSTTKADLHYDPHQGPPPAVLKAATPFKARKGANMATASSKLSSSSASSPDTAADLSPSSDTEEQVAEAPVDPVQLMAAPHAVFRQANQGSGAAPFMVCFVVIVLLAFAAVLSVKEILKLGTPESNDSSSRFCCADEVKTILKYVNATLDPCDSFFEFVCSNVAQRDPSKTFSPPLALRPEFERNGIAGLNTPRSKAGAFLRSLFDSCLNFGSDENAVIGKLAAFLVSVGGAYLRHAGTTNALAFLLLSNLKYGIPSVVSIKLKGHGAISIVHNTLYDLNDSKFQRCLKDSLAKFNNYAENNVSVAEVTAFAKTLHARYPADVRTERFSGANLSALYQKWNPMAALNIIPVGLRYITEVDLNGTVQIDYLFESLGSPEKGTSDAGAAYILACSVYKALVELALPSVHSKSNRLAFCTRQIDLLPRVRDAVYSDEFVTPAKKLQATRVINAVIETIKSDCDSSSLFDSIDAGLLQSLFDSMSLVVPGETARPEIAEASLKESFIERLFQGRAYEFEAQLAMARLGLPVTHTSGRGRSYLLLHNGVSILVFPAAFALFRDDAAHTDVFNTPVIPWALAESTWRFILAETSAWSQGAKLRIEKLVNCFRDRYVMNATSIGDGTLSSVDTVAASLGLSSVLRSFSERLWYKVEVAESFWSLSHSQYFYMRETFYRCPVGSDPAGRKYVDVPLRQNKDFSRTFQCESYKLMVMADVCRLPRNDTSLF